LLFDPQHDKIVLVEQFRIAPAAAGKNPWLMEIVLGMVDSNETPEQAAARAAAAAQEAARRHEFEREHLGPTLRDRLNGAGVTSTSGGEVNTEQKDKKGNNSKPKGVMFLRLSLNDDPTNKTADENSVTWQKLINTDLRAELTAKHLLDDDGDESALKFVLACNKDAAIGAVKWADAHGYEIILSSHGTTTDIGLASFLGMKRYPIVKFEDEVNKAIGHDVLTPATHWYKCDPVYWTRTPDEILDQQVREDITERLYRSKE